MRHAAVFSYLVEALSDTESELSPHTFLPTPKQRPMHHQRPWSACWLRSLGCLFGRGKNQALRRSSSPDKTALMSFHDDVASLPSTPYRSTDSEYATSPQLETNFPYWDAFESPTFDVATDKEGKDEEDRIRTSLQSLLKLHQYHYIDAINEREDYVAGGDDEEDSFHFSTSTDPPRSTFNTRITITESSSVFAFVAEERSVNTSRSSRTKHSRVSLEQFIEKQEQSYAAAKNLAEVAVADGASIGSAFLTVSFDDSYPQLMLQPSLDGTASHITGSSVPSRNMLGASYPHPASSVTSFDTAQASISCTPKWLDENIDMVWSQLDGVGYNEAMDEDDGGIDYEETDEDVAPHTETDGGSDIDVEIRLSKNATMEEESNSSFPDGNSDVINQNCDGGLDWSFPLERSISKVLSEIIGKEVIQPVLKPICQFVDATAIPEPSKLRRPLSGISVNDE